MFNFSDNYQLRQYYLQKQQVPTQSMIKRKMSPNLAAVLFKSLDPKVKVLAGLEPPLKGGGSDWYVSPKKILVENRAVLIPLDHEMLTKINHFGIVLLEFQILIAHHKDLKKEKIDMLLKSDNVWKNTVETISQKQWNKNVQLQTKNNTEYIKYVLDSFSDMYRKSLNNIEMIIYDGLLNEIKKTQDETRLKMKKRYDILCKAQAILINHKFTAKLKRDKARLKAKFIENLETGRTEMTNRLHDLNVDKHVAAEKLRTFLEYQKLACQIYVYLKEKEECFKEMEESKQEHRKYVKNLTEASTLLKFEASLAEQKERKRQENNSIWLKKVSYVVKNFQMFVSYCLNKLPDHAEFFINMEKLMLLQVNEAIEDPTAKSIIAVEEEELLTPVPQPKPFYLFCDRGFEAKVEPDLCPKHSGTSSASELPAMIINKRCLYAACDNFDQFTNKIKEFIHGNRGDDADFKDDLVYDHFVPVKYTTSQQLSEIKLESSLLQVLQQEMSNIKKVPLAGYNIPHCSGISVEDAKNTIKTNEKSTGMPLVLLSVNKSRLEHEREPKLEKYMKYTKPKSCGCAKSSKNHITEHLPVYMRNMSMFDALELPNYETCSFTTLQKLVKHARAQRTPSPTYTISSKTKDMCTQFSDEKYDLLCTCFSHSNLDSFEPVKNDNQFNLENVSPSYMTNTQSSFAIDRAHSLRQLIEDAPELVEIFNKKK